MRADCTMLAAVCPSPQIEASFMAEATSARSPVDVLAVRESRQDSDLALRADPAGHALAAGFVGEELSPPPHGVHQIGGLVDNHDRPRARPSRRGAATLPRSAGDPGPPA